MLNINQILDEVKKDFGKVKRLIDQKDFAGASMPLGRINGYCLLLQQILASKSMEGFEVTKKM